MKDRLDPLEAHVDAAAPAGSAAALALLFAPADCRRALGAVLAFAHEVHAVTGKNPETASLRLSWWREELGRAVHGRPSHPVMQALVDAGLTGERALTELGHLVRAAAIDLGAGDAPLDDYLDLRFGAVATLLALAADPAHDDVAARREFARGIGLATLRRERSAAARRGNERLPASTSDADLVAQARGHLEAVPAAIPDAAAARQRTLLVLASLTRRHLDNPPRAFRDLLRAWRTARRAARRSR